MFVTDIQLNDCANNVRIISEKELDAESINNKLNHMAFVKIEDAVVASAHVVSIKFNQQVDVTEVTVDTSNS